MPTMTPHALLRIQGNGGFRVTDVEALLASLEEAYNAVSYFDSALDETARAVSRFGGPFPYVLVVGRGSRRSRTVAGRDLPGGIPSPQEIASMIRGRDRLLLKSVRLESPGFWAFLGTLNPLEVIRHYLVDRHERRKDKQYREPLEEERLGLENKLLENRVIKERIELAREAGVPEDQIRLLFNQLVVRPMEALGQHQDRGLIDDAEVLPLEGSTEDGQLIRD